MEVVTVEEKMSKALGPTIGLTVGVQILPANKSFLSSKRLEITRSMESWATFPTETVGIINRYPFQSMSLKVSSG